MKETNELTDHLGNVHVVVSDRKLAVDDGVYDANGNQTSTTPDGIIDYFTADVLSATDYGPFGEILPGRSYNSNSYRYGMMGFEKDDEIKGSGNHISFNDYGYDPRTATRWRPDPLMKKYPFLSPYAPFARNPILFIDKNGEDILVSGNDLNKTIALLEKVTQGEVKIKFEEASKMQGGGYRIIVEPKKGISISDETKVVQKLAGSRNDHRIELISEGKNQTTETKRGNSLIKFNPSNLQNQMENEDGTTGRSPFIGLFHELLHSEKINDLTDDNKTRLEGDEVGDGQAIYPTVSEQRTTLSQPNGEVKPLLKDEFEVRTKENKLREKVGEPKRVVGTTAKVEE